MADSRSDEEYLLAHFEGLRQEQLAKIAETFSLTQFALITHGAMWAWLITNGDWNGGDGEAGDPTLRWMAAFAPILLSLMFAALYWALRQDIRGIGRIIARLEDRFQVPNSLAYERDTTETVTKTDKIYRGLWIALVVGNGVGAWLLLR